MDVAAVRAHDPRRPHLRARRLRRQGQLPAAAARRVRDGRRGRAARARARARRGRRGDRLGRRQRLGARRRPRRRRGDRVRRGHGRRADAGGDARHARHGVRRPRGPHGRADRALGLYGGAALNAFHALHRRAGRACCPARTAGCPSRCAPGVDPPTAGRAAPRGSGCRRRRRARRGGRPARRRDAPRPSCYMRTIADASLDVHRVGGGASAHDRARREASCDLSVRLARRPGPGRDRRRARGAAARRPAGRRRAEFATDTADAVVRRPVAAAPIAGRRRALGARLRPRAGADPLRRLDPRAGGVRGARHPAIVGGFALPEDSIHAPDESYRSRASIWACRAARALYEELGGAARAAPSPASRARRARRGRGRHPAADGVPRLDGPRLDVGASRSWPRRSA